MSNEGKILPKGLEEKEIQDGSAGTASPSPAGSPEASRTPANTDRIFAVRKHGQTIEIPVLFENNRIEFAYGNSEPFDRSKYEIFPAWHWQAEEFRQMRAEARKAGAQ